MEFQEFSKSKRTIIKFILSPENKKIIIEISLYKKYYK